MAYLRIHVDLVLYADLGAHMSNWLVVCRDWDIAMSFYMLVVLLPQDRWIHQQSFAKHHL